MSEKTLEIKTKVRNVTLVIRLFVAGERTPSLTATLNHKKPGLHYSTQLVFTHGEVANCYLHRDDYGNRMLWIGSACFDVREEDIDLIAETFGICIHGRKDGAHAATDKGGTDGAASEKRP